MYKRLLLGVTFIMMMGLTTKVHATGLSGNGYIDYRVDTQQKPTADEFNAIIAEWVVNSEKQYGNKSKLRGKGQVILDTAEEYGLNPYLFVAQLAYESGWGASPYAVAYNNFGGIKCLGKGYKCSIDGRGHTVTVFSSVEEGIRENGSLLHRQYLEKGYTKLGEVASRYLIGKNLNNITTDQYKSVNTYTDVVRSISERFGVNVGKLYNKTTVRERQAYEAKLAKQEEEKRKKAEEERQRKEDEESKKRLAYEKLLENQRSNYTPTTVFDDIIVDIPLDGINSLVMVDTLVKTTVQHTKY